MPSPLSERERDACLDIVANARRAKDFIGTATFEAFVADERTNFAVVRCLEMVSEASRQLSAETRGRHPEVPWRQVADAGNFYRHAYRGISLDIIWLTVHDELPVPVVAAEAELARSPDP